MAELRLKKGFNFLSHFYDLLLFISSGRTVIHSQVSLIKELPHCSKALLIGEGTGNFLKYLAASGKVDYIVYVDISEGMCQQAQKKLKTINYTSKIEFRIGSFQQLQPSETFDLISTNYFMDVFTSKQLDEYIPLLLTHLKPSGLWYCTDFYNPAKLRLKDYLFKPFLFILYLFFRVVCNLPAKKLVPYFEKLAQNGLQETSSEYFFLKFIKSAIHIKR